MIKEKKLSKRLKEFIKTDPDILGGAPCIKGTRIPINAFVAHALRGDLYKVYPQFKKKT